MTDGEEFWDVKELEVFKITYIINQEIVPYQKQKKINNFSRFDFLKVLGERRWQCTMSVSWRDK